MTGVFIKDIANFLRRNRAEVVKMSIYEYDERKKLQMLQEQYWNMGRNMARSENGEEELRRAGRRAEGRAEGRAEENLKKQYV